MRDFKFYKIYGLIIKSEIPLYDSILIDNIQSNYDVYITLGMYPEKPLGKCISVGIFNFYSDYISFDIIDIGKYELINGDTIYINPVSNCNKEDLSKYIIGSALGLLLYQRNTIALHGGALVINGNGIIIAGDIGAGKTTTVASLIKKGYGFLSDDVSAINKNNTNEYLINPCIPYQKMGESTAKFFNYDIDNLYKIDKAKNKYFTPCLETFLNTPKRLKTIFYLTISDNYDVTCERVKGAEKFNIIYTNIFRKEFIPNGLIKPIYIKECLTLSNNVSIYRISRPQNKNSINEVISYIETIAKGDNCDGKINKDL